MIHHRSQAARRRAETVEDMDMAIQLSDSFNYGKLIRFALPSVCMTIFTSVYGIVDGFFIASFVGKTAFAAVNFIFPVLTMLGAIGLMFGTGGSALVAQTMGKGDRERAGRLFSLFILFSALFSLTLALLAFVFLRHIASALGAEGELLEYSVLYGRIIVCAVPALVLQTEFQCFFVAAEKLRLGLAVTVAAGLSNFVLDALLVWVFPFGLAGAALATAISQIVGGLVPLLYFTRPNGSPLRLVRSSFDARAILVACLNGSSEFMSSVAISVAGMVYNVQLLRYAGENGVAAYGTMLYVAWIFSATFMGYGIGVAPVVAYHDGAAHPREVRNILRKSLAVISAASLMMVVISHIFAETLCGIFLGGDGELLELAWKGFRLYSFCFLFMGFAIFGSAFFTALNNGLISALIAVLRTLVFEIGAVLILPLFLGIAGIWLSTVAAEFMAALLTFFFLLQRNDKRRS